MTPCTCNREMGDNCAKCAPPVETGREGWPVLVRNSEGEYVWPAPYAELAVWGEDDIWYASRRNTSSASKHPTAKAAADAIRARLPTEPTTASALTALKAAVGGALDGVSIKETFGGQEDDASEREAQRLYDLGYRSGPRIAWLLDLAEQRNAEMVAFRDRLCAALADGPKDADEIVTAVGLLMEHANRDDTPSPTLLDILDLLDMAGKDHPAVAKLTAMARREIVP